MAAFEEAARTASVGKKVDPRDCDNVFLRMELLARHAVNKRLIDASSAVGMGRNAADVYRMQGRLAVSIGTIILIILVIALLGGFSGIGGGPFYGTGYYGGGGLGLIVVILLILVLLGRI